MLDFPHRQSSGPVLAVAGETIADAADVWRLDGFRDIGFIVKKPHIGIQHIEITGVQNSVAVTPRLRVRHVGDAARQLLEALILRVGHDGDNFERSAILVPSHRDAAADRIALEHLPRLVMSEQLPMPFACGVIRPAIVLPADGRTIDLALGWLLDFSILPGNGVTSGFSGAMSALGYGLGSEIGPRVVLYRDDDVERYTADALPAPLAGTPIVAPSGWIEPDRATLRTGVDRVYAVGDCTVIPTARAQLPHAGVFAAAQGEVAAANMVADLRGGAEARFDGHGFCFTIGRGNDIVAASVRELDAEAAR